MPNEKILEKNFIAMEELSCPSDYKLLKNTYILHLTGGYHFFNYRCLPNKNIKKIYREPIWPYVERINILGNFQTIEEVIRNRLIVDEGDPLNELLFNKSVDNIKSLGIFKNVK